MSEPFAYRQGQFLPQSQAGLSLFDAGFVQGVTLTDRIRTFLRQPFRLAEHLTRFRQSCQLARVPLEVSDDQISQACHELLVRNSALLSPEQELEVILFATPGEASGPPTLGIHTVPLNFTRLRRLVADGAHLRVPPLRQIPAALIDRRIKQRSRLLWWLAERWVQDADPLASALLLDDDGTVTETASANLLLVRNGAVHTPPGDQVLAGVSRQVVRELCGELGIPFVERRLTRDDCLTADEVFLSCTSFCLAPVARLDEHVYPTAHPVLERLLAAWSAAVGVDIRGQILGTA